MKKLLFTAIILTALGACKDDEKKSDPSPKREDTGPNTTRYFTAVYKGQPVTWGGRARIQPLTSTSQRVFISGGSADGRDSVFLVTEKATAAAWTVPANFTFAYIEVKSASGSTSNPSGRIVINYDPGSNLLTGTFTSPGQAASGTFSVPRP